MTRKRHLLTYFKYTIFVVVVMYIGHLLGPFYCLEMKELQLF